MTRPASHRSPEPERSCLNCRHSRVVCYKLDLLCFHGDQIEVVGQCHYPIDADHVLLDGEEVGLLEGDEYDRVWAGRVVDDLDVCDCWEGETKDGSEGP